MSPFVRVVVGNEYGSFAQNAGVVTFAAIESELSTLAVQQTLIIGQGLTSEQRQKLVDIGGSFPAGPKVLNADLPSPQGWTHKALEQNVLCSEPVCQSGTSYRCALLIDDALDRLADHITGQHVNGMLLIEACRQASIASIERHYLQGDTRKWGFSWTRCDTRFLAFVFPLPTQITVNLPAVDAFGTRQQVPLSFPVCVEQAGVTVCEMVMEVTLLEGDVVDRIEARRASRALAAVLSSVVAPVQLAQPV